MKKQQKVSCQRGRWGCGWKEGEEGKWGQRYADKRKLEFR